MQPSKTVIFDIDGTLANIEHRRANLRKNPPDWKVFNAEMGEDIPNADVVSLYRSLWNTDNYELLDPLLAEGREIAFTVDDRQQVVDMWRRRGITCLQCDVGDF